MSSANRRDFLRTAAVASAAGLGDLAFLSRLRPVTADETRLDPRLVQIDPSLSPLVNLIETTPRDRLLEEVGHQVKNGLSYRELLAALLVAGVRNIQPRPVGFKFHAVLVVNSAHLASIDSPQEHRWLPIFWALDNFKSSQAQNEQQGGWRMKAVEEGKLPAARNAKTAFVDAMENWDEPAADAAIAAWSRTAATNDLFDTFARLGTRDFRDIGHKIIYVANAFRTLQVIGRQHAEPVLRSIAYALLQHEGDNPAKRDGDPDRPGRRNAERVTKIRDAWQDGKPDSGATTAVLNAVRDASADDICTQIVELLNKGVAPQSVWDGLQLGAGELLMRQPGIVGLHTLTTANAMRYCYEACGVDATRRLLLLQCAAFLPLFRGAMKSRGKIEDAKIDGLQPVGPNKTEGPEWVFADVGHDRAAAAAKAYGFLNHGGDAKLLINMARLLIFLKGTDSHDYKFSSAVLEDYRHVSPGLRDRFFAASTYWLKGSSAKDNTLVKRIREALS